ncbi:MAG: gamma-glutamylcyclotransferase [Deltaproteobacteria bacterium]|nr:gamma-glutamylcyclotransferase [Deltaproteobacteria bacterium]
MNRKIFVYGSLRKGFHNHCFLTGPGVRELGPAMTDELYAMYAERIPYVVKDEPVTPIRGEVYAVDPETLERLDSLEEHPRWYRRQEITVTLDNGESVTAWLYFCPTPRGVPVPSGDYSDHQRPQAPRQRLFEPRQAFA